MLIKALCDYYDILSGVGKVLPAGYSNVKTHYIVALNDNGQIDEIIDCQIKEEQVQKNGKTKEKKIPRNEVMPKRTEKPGIDANFIEHRPVYLFGLNFENGKLDPFDKTQKAVKSHKKFVDVNLGFIEGIDDPLVNAYRRFIENWDPEKETENEHLLGLGKRYTVQGYVFCLSGEPDKLLHKNPKILERWQNIFKESKVGNTDVVEAQCAVSGEFMPVARIHNKIRGVHGGEPSGNVLIGFNNPSENSYGNEQSYNSNISEKAMLKYTEALNYLLNDNSHKIIMDDMTIIFWAMDPSGACEDIFLAALNGGTEKMSAEETENMLHDVWENGKNGIAYTSQLKNIDAIDENVDFYMFGIKPNSSRLSIKFFDRKSYSDILWNVAKFQQDIRVTEDIRIVPLYKIKKELLSPKSSNDKINPGMFSRFFESIVNGNRHPTELLETLVRRIRTDTDIEISYIRAGLIKSCLNRMKQKEEIKVALNENNFNQAYLCGRLFAVLERLQNRASGGNLNATIKDKFFGSASSKPAMVFPKLIRLAQNHISKLESDREKIYFNKLIGEIIDGLDDKFPDTLLLIDQGEFDIGYYQQVQEFFRKKNDKEVKIEE